MQDDYFIIAWAYNKLVALGVGEQNSSEKNIHMMNELRKILERSLASGNTDG